MSAHIAPEHTSVTRHSREQTENIILVHNWIFPINNIYGDFLFVLFKYVIFMFIIISVGIVILPKKDLTIYILFCFIVH